MKVEDCIPSMPASLRAFSFADWLSMEMTASTLSAYTASASRNQATPESRVSGHDSPYLGRG